MNLDVGLIYYICFVLEKELITPQFDVCLRYWFCFREGVNHPTIGCGSDIFLLF